MNIILLEICGCLSEFCQKCCTFSWKISIFLLCLLFSPQRHCVRSSTKLTLNAMPFILLFFVLVAFFREKKTWSITYYYYYLKEAKKNYNFLWFSVKWFGYHNLFCQLLLSLGFLFFLIVQYSICWHLSFFLFFWPTSCHLSAVSRKHDPCLDIMKLYMCIHRYIYLSSRCRCALCNSSYSCFVVICGFCFWIFSILRTFVFYVRLGGVILVCWTGDREVSGSTSAQCIAR